MHCSHLTQFIPVGVSQWQWYIPTVILLMYNHSACSQPTVIFTSIGWGNNECAIHKLSKRLGQEGGCWSAWACTAGETVEGNILDDSSCGTWAGLDLVWWSWRWRWLWSQIFVFFRFWSVKTDWRYKSSVRYKSFYWILRMTKDHLKMSWTCGLFWFDKINRELTWYTMFILEELKAQRHLKDSGDQNSHSATLFHHFMEDK